MYNTGSRYNTQYMTISNMGIQFIMNREGCVLTPYNDSNGYATIGVGHLLHKSNVTEKDRNDWSNFNQEMAARLLREDISNVENSIRSLVRVSLSQNEFDAICSFVFNIGINGFKNSEFLKELNKGEYKGELMLNWRKPSSLRSRREKEVALFEKGIC